MPPPSAYPRGADGKDTSAACVLVPDKGLYLHQLNGRIIASRPGIQGCPVHYWTHAGLTSAHEYCKACGLVREVVAPDREPEAIPLPAGEDDPNTIEGAFKADA